MTGTFEIVEAGWSTTIQDRGRAGLAHLGIPPSGAVDPALAATMNRLVGNPIEAALIETTGHLVLRAGAALLIASTSEPQPRSLRAGDTFSEPFGGDRLWKYVAIRGGVEVAPVLGSRSTDTLSGLGPPPVRAGDVVEIGPEPSSPVHGELAPLVAPAALARVTPGARAGWFEDDWPSVMASTPWTVSDTSRVGVRLTGAVLRRRRTDELPSEGLVRGAIQIPPDGRPVMMLADHPTTGGYPVIAVVDPDDVANVAQRPSGSSIGFRL